MTRRKSWSGPKPNPPVTFEMLTLDQISPGKRCRVEALCGSPALTQRLLELGVLEGEELLVVGRAPLGDPIEIESALTRLSLRRTEAAQVQVVTTD
jgi:ferrous iron transport protein A